MADELPRRTSREYYRSGWEVDLAREVEPEVDPVIIKAGGSHRG